MSDGASTAFDGRAFARDLTHAPGVYRMLAADASVLYVGKAKNLQKRVGSYFARPQLEPRIALMVSQVAAIEVTITRTESEALILENELIKSLKPRYNVLLRDGKAYPSIHLTGDEFPRIEMHRGARARGGRYFGPYPSSLAVRETINRVHKLFRLRGCSESFFRNRTRPCLQHQIKRCSAPCVGLIAVDAYDRDVRHASLFLQGRSDDVNQELVALMEHHSQELEFEKAAELRDEIGRIKQIQSRQFVSGAETDCDVLAVLVREGTACVQALFFRDGMNLGSRNWFLRASEAAEPGDVLSAFVSQHYADLVPPRVILLSHAIDDEDLLAEVFAERAGHRVEIRVPQRGDRVRLIELAQRNADIALASRLGSDAVQRERWQGLASLLDLVEVPERVECFDISHTLGEGTVASCVVATAAGPQRSLYRRFNIRQAAAGDDYAAMREVIDRRFRRLVAEQSDLPDLLLIDGGRGQVDQALAALEEIGLSGLVVIGISKGPDRRVGFEEIVLGNSGRVLQPRANDPGLLAMQAIRDEAHRFAITGHRQRREKARVESVLEEIEGVGARRRSGLLKQFGGLQGVIGAGIEELMQVKGIDRSLAERIYAHLHR